MVDAVSCFLLDLVVLDNLFSVSEKLAPTRIIRRTIGTQFPSMEVI